MIDQFFSEFEDAYRKSGITIPFDRYLQLSKLMLFIGFIVFYFILFGLHYLLGVQGPQLFTGPLILSLASPLVVVLLMFWYPLYTKDLAVSDIDHNLLYSVSFMLMLSKGGLSIERIIERVAETEPSKYIKSLLNKFLINIKVYGYNPQESLQDIAKRSPSEAFTKFIEGVVTTTQTSGDLDNLFEYESEVLIQRKEEESQALLNNIGFLSEIYVTILVIAPLLMMILLTTFSFTGGDFSGPSGINSMNLMVFAGIPIIAVLLMIIVDMQVSSE